MRTFTPADLGMASINLKSLATTTSSLKVPVGDFFQFGVHILKTLAAGTPTTGLASVGVNLYTGPTGATALVPATGATLINTKTALGELWTFGGAGSAIGPSGTKSNTSDALKVCEWIELFFTVTEVVDVVATATADIYLQAEGYSR